jgi:HAD superfamily hydrolase (TIGR01509 family)
MDALYERLISARAFVFDFYGTLVEIDYEPPQMWEQLNDLGYHSDPELQSVFEADGFDGCLTPSLSCTPSYGEWKHDNLRRFVRLSGVPDHLVESTISTLLGKEKQATKKAVSHANSVVRLLRQHGKKIGLCSNWDFAIQPYLDQAGLLEFDGVTVSAEIGARKPNAVLFNDICSKLDVPPEETVFIGDNWQTDIVGALRSGMTPVWIRHHQASRGLTHLVLEFDTLAAFESYLRQVL